MYGAEDVPGWVSPEEAVFVGLGMSLKRARALCDHLDEQRPVGLHAAELAGLIVRCLAAEADRFASALDVAERTIHNLQGSSRGPTLFPE